MWLITPRCDYTTSVIYFQSWWVVNRYTDRIYTQSESESISMPNWMQKCLILPRTVSERKVIICVAFENRDGCDFKWEEKLK